MHDVFIFSGDAGQIAKVIEMKREDDAGGGYVMYEQYVNRNGEWLQEPAQTLQKSFIGFCSRYSPYEGTIEHLVKVKKDIADDNAHLQKAMADAGFPDFKNLPPEVRKTKEFVDAWRKAAMNMPSIKRSSPQEVEGRDK